MIDSNDISVIVQGAINKNETKMSSKYKAIPSRCRDYIINLGW